MPAPVTTRTAVVTASRATAPDLSGPAGAGVPVRLAGAPGADPGPGGRLVVLGEDVGRPAALNRAVAALDDDVDWVLLADPAARLDPSVLAALRAVADAHPRAGLLGAALRGPDGSPVPSAGPAPTRADLRHGRIRPDRSGRVAAAQVGWVSTACALVRRAAWDSVDGFDPRYLGSGRPGPDPADVDLADRLAVAGWLVRHVPTVHVELGPHPAPDGPDGHGILEPVAAGLRRFAGDRTGTAGRVLLAVTARWRS